MYLSSSNTNDLVIKFYLATYDLLNMKKVIFWVDCRPTTPPAGFYANDVSVKGWQVESKVERFADNENLTGVWLISCADGNATSTSPTIRYLKWNVCMCHGKIFVYSTCI